MKYINIIILQLLMSSTEFHGMRHGMILYSQYHCWWLPGDSRFQEISRNCINRVLQEYYGPLFTKRYDVLPQNLVKSRSREIGCYNDGIALKFQRHRDACQISEPLGTRISRPRVFTRSCGKTSVGLMNRGLGLRHKWINHCFIIYVAVVTIWTLFCRRYFQIHFLN